MKLQCSKLLMPLCRGTRSWLLAWFLQRGAVFDMTSWTSVSGPTLQYKLSVTNGTMTSSTGHVY
jgi:hypothetical protein